MQSTVFSGLNQNWRECWCHCWWTNWITCIYQGSRAVRLSQASVQLAGWCLVLYLPGFDPWPLTQTPPPLSQCFHLIRCLVKGQTSPVCLNDECLLMHEICSRLYEYCNQHWWNRSCENICVGIELWLQASLKKLMQFMSSLFKMHFEFEIRNLERKKSYWSWISTTVFCYTTSSRHC